MPLTPFPPTRAPLSFWRSYPHPRLRLLPAWTLWPRRGWPAPRAPLDPRMAGTGASSLASKKEPAWPVSRRHRRLPCALLSRAAGSAGRGASRGGAALDALPALDTRRRPLSSPRRAPAPPSRARSARRRRDRPGRFPAGGCSAARGPAAARSGSSWWPAGTAGRPRGAARGAGRCGAVAGAARSARSDQPGRGERRARGARWGDAGRLLLGVTARLEQAGAPPPGPPAPDPGSCGPWRAGQHDWAPAGAWPEPPGILRPGAPRWAARRAPETRAPAHRAPGAGWQGGVCA